MQREFEAEARQESIYKIYVVIITKEGGCLAFSFFPNMIQIVDGPD